MNNSRFVFCFFMGSSLGLKDKKYTNFHTFITSLVIAPLKSAPFCFRKRFDRLYYINDSERNTRVHETKLQPSMNVTRGTEIRIRVFRSLALSHRQ